MCVKVALSMILQESRVFVESVEYLIGTGQDMVGYAHLEVRRKASILNVQWSWHRETKFGD